MKEIYFKSLNQTLNLNELIKYLNIEKDTIAYLGGSAIEGKFFPKSKGMGNRLSDIDLYIILPNEKFLKKYSSYTSISEKNDFFSLNGIPFDITYYKKEEIDLLISSINSLEIIPNKRIFDIFEQKNGWNSYKVNEFINRLFHSIPLQNNDNYKTLLKDIDLNKYCKIYSQFLTTILDNNIIDIEGNLESNQFDTALFCTREVYMVFLKIIIYKNLDTVDRDKWISLKINNLNFVNKKPVIEMYYKLFYDIKKDNIKSSILECISFMNDYLLHEDNSII